MRLRGIDFGPVLDASGVRGFFGEGYAHHAVWKPFGLRFKGSTFVAKTTTLEARDGNMPLGEDLRPKQLMPKCVVVRPWKGITLNAVGLSGPGAKALFETGRWQARTEPFFISFMSVERDAASRQRELEGFVAECSRHLDAFRAPFGLQLNFSCPNVGLDPRHLIDEVGTALAAAATLGVPLMPKFNLLLPPEAAAEIERLPGCDALCVSNTLPWGSRADRIDWPRLFGSAGSPLGALGGGGLSGAPLLPLVREWVVKARRAGVSKPLNAGGGILGPDDAQTLLEAGADSVFIGSMAILRPWRVAATIRRARRLSA